MDDFSLLSDEQIDALKEVGTIGAGHAANALSQLAGRKIIISVPEVKVISLKEVVELVGPPENLAAVVYMNLMGDTQGKSLLIFSKRSAFNLVDILMKRPAGQTKFLREIDCSAIKEVGNILAGAFLTTLADFLNITLIPSVPRWPMIWLGQFWKLWLSNSVRMRITYSVSRRNLWTQHSI